MSRAPRAARGTRSSSTCSARSRRWPVQSPRRQRASCRSAEVEDRARAARRACRDALLVGERHGRRAAGFRRGQLADRAAGARSARQHGDPHHARRARRVCCGGRRGRGADRQLREYLRHRAPTCATRPAHVTLVRMGHEARERCAEDDLYADVARCAACGRGSRVLPACARRCAAHPRRASSSIRPATGPRWRTSTYCTDVDRYAFVLRLRRAPRRAARARAHRLPRLAVNGLTRRRRAVSSPGSCRSSSSCSRDAARRRAAAPAHARGRDRGPRRDRDLQAGDAPASHTAPGFAGLLASPAARMGRAREPVRAADGLRGAVAAFRAEPRAGAAARSTCRTTGAAASCCS